MLLKYKRILVVWWTKHMVDPYTSPKIRSLLRENRRSSARLRTILEELQMKLNKLEE